jgi:hypothetical protein
MRIWNVAFCRRFSDPLRRFFAAAVSSIVVDSIALPYLRNLAARPRTSTNTV